MMAQVLFSIKIRTLTPLSIQSQCLNDLTTLERQKIESVIGKRQWEMEGGTVGPPMSEDKDEMYVYQIWLR